MVSNKVQNMIVPFNVYTNISQIVVSYGLMKFGCNASIIELILLFL